MGKTMLTGKVRVYRSNVSRKYKVVYNGHKLYITPLEVKTEDGTTIAVGNIAALLFWSIMMRNENVLRELLPRMIYVAFLLSQ